jgi:hypothetical protein
LQKHELRVPALLKILRKEQREVDGTVEEKLLAEN